MTCSLHSACKQLLVTARHRDHEAAVSGSPMSTGMIAVRQFEGRGRGLAAAVPIAAGDVVLEDSACLLWTSRSGAATSCAACLRSLTGTTAIPCPACGKVGFCSTECLQRAQQPGAHSAYECRAQAALDSSGLDAEQTDALAFLTHADALRLAAQTSPEARERWVAMESLASVPQPEALMRELHGRLSAAAAAAGFSPTSAMDVPTATALLGIEAANSFGVMATDAPPGERRLRGAGIYPRAAMLNHDCLPNMARFDDFDGSDRSKSTVLTFRALHDIPAGEELTISYVPLYLDIEEREEVCQQYGFTCQCQRCQSGRKHEAAVAAGREPDQDDSGLQNYIDAFLLKYTCGELDCLGTMAPIKGTDRRQCNFCGVIKTELDFLAELEALQE